MLSGLLFRHLGPPYNEHFAEGLNDGAGNGNGPAGAPAGRDRPLRNAAPKMGMGRE